MLAKTRTHVDVYIQKQTKSKMQNIIRYKITNQPGLYTKATSRNRKKTQKIENEQQTSLHFAEMERHPQM